MNKEEKSIEFAKRNREYLFKETDSVIKPIGKIIEITDNVDSNTTRITIEIPKQVVRTSIIGEIYRLEIVQDKEIIQKELVDSLYPDIRKKAIGKEE
jgi:hypothetical protein